MKGRGDHLVTDWWAAVALGALTSAVFARVGTIVANHGSTHLDVAVRDWIVAHQSPTAVRVFTAITDAGQPRWLYAVAVGGAAFLWRRGHRRVSMRCVAVPLVAMAVYESVKRIYARARPPGIGGLTEGAFSFPSAHSTASAAVCASLAYVFWREGFVGRATALSFAFGIPAVIGISRLYLDRHWTTDVLGGWSAGYLIAALSAGLYNRGRRRRHAQPAKQADAVPFTATK
jgi:undecaprenyl-diphosphatase